jgi:transcriptional regulator with XRE-family HTH domain
MDQRVAFGRRVRSIRENLGYSQERLAELACLDRTYIGGVERGERNIGLVNIWRIADALKVDPSQLFVATTDPPTSGPLDGRGEWRKVKRTTRKSGTWKKRQKR